MYPGKGDWHPSPFLSVSAYWLPVGEQPSLPWWSVLPQAQSKWTKQLWIETSECMDQTILSFLSGECLRYFDTVIQKSCWLCTLLTLLPHKVVWLPALLLFTRERSCIPMFYTTVRRLLTWALAYLNLRPQKRWEHESIQSLVTQGHSFLTSVPLAC